MGNANWMRTYTLKAGAMKSEGFMIGNTESPTQETLHISFSVEKSNSDTPNDAKIQIWNLSPQNLSILESKDCTVELRAGYGRSMTLLIVGTVSSAVTTNDNADRMTELQVVDGLVPLRDTVISLSMNGMVNTKDIYQKIADEMGVSIEYADDLQYTTLPNGFSFAGKARDALDKVVTNNGHAWTMQNQVLQITLPGHAIATRGYVLSSETGLIGVPKKVTIDSGENEKTGWDVEYLLNGAIGVNDIVELQSKDANGYYLVHKVTIDGDNMSGDWICSAELLKTGDEEGTSTTASTTTASGPGATGPGVQTAAIHSGDTVAVTRTVQSEGKTYGFLYAGGQFAVRPSYDVIKVRGNKAIIGKGSMVEASVNIQDLKKL